MNRHSRQQRGAIMAMMAILIVVLIGIAALALDLGRLFVERTELQNAADAAALAAAVELDGKSGARSRAMAAAREVFLSKLDRGIYFGSDFDEEDDITCFKFYSSIDPEKVPAQEPSDPPASDYCTDGTAISAGATDAEARFVELTIDLTETGEGIPLFFLPVLDLIPGVDNVPTEGGTAARALAGVENVPCYQPAMFMCVDNDLANLRVNGTPIEEGLLVWLKAHQGGDATLTSGNFGFLLPQGAETTGAPSLKEYMASSGQELCVADAKYQAKTGTVAQQATWGFNTRFDSYKSGQTSADEFPPAPNIITYPRDENLISNPPSDDYFRIGNGEWEPEDYWTQYHDGVTPPDDYEDWSRWRTYRWELGLIDDDGAPKSDATQGNNTIMPADRVNEPDPLPEPPASYPTPVDELGNDYTCDPSGGKDYQPSRCHGEPDPANFYCLEGDTTCDNYQDLVTGKIYPSVAYPSPVFPSDKEVGATIPLTTNAERRIFYVSALECAKYELQGAFNNKEDDPDVDVLRDGKVLQFFLTQPASDADTTKFEMFAEYIGPTEEGAGMTRRVIQLYE